jgi:hypothetical protein
LPENGGIIGPATGYTVVGDGGRVRTRLVGIGEPGCTIEIKVTDPTHAIGTLNNQTYTTTVNASGTWSLDLELDDCHPVIEIRQVCDGEAGEIIRRQIYVDTTRPSAGLADQSVYVGSNGEVKIVLNPGASDDSHFPGNVLSYEWFLIGASRTALCSGCPGVLEIIKGVGEYEIEVVVTDSAGNKTTKRCRVSVLRRPTEIVCVQTVVNFAGMVTLNYTLKDKLTGEVLTRTIKYKLNGNEIASTFEANLLPGLYNIGAEFAGDEIYGACSIDGSSCPLEVRALPGKITGGGSIDQRLRNFGFVVQTRSQGSATLYTGNLEYQEKPLGYNLKSQSISVIAISADGLHGVFGGTATMNDRPGYTFTVFVDDLAEPGAEVDKFRIEIKGPDGFSYDSNTRATQGGILDQGGNIQIHKPN